jgi:hypothetical protein
MQTPNAIAFRANPPTSDQCNDRNISVSAIHPTAAHAQLTIAVWRCASTT